MNGRKRNLILLVWAFCFLSFLLGQVISTTAKEEEKKDNVEILQLTQAPQKPQQQQQHSEVENVTTAIAATALFVNSTEWRELGANETSVPRGSHVRLDFASGKRFVKIVNETTTAVSAQQEEKETESAADRIFTILSEVSNSDERDEKLLNQIELLRKLRRENRTVEFESQLNQVWNERQLFLAGFQNETKKKMEEELHNDDPIWVNLKKLNHTSNTNELEIIDSLTILVDNVEDLKLALEFEKLNGFTICYGYLFAESDLIKNRALHLFGSVVKNYAPLQESLLKSKPALVNQLLLLLDKRETEDRSFFALANLMRGNTFAHENDYAELYLEFVVEKFFTLSEKSIKTNEEMKLLKKMGDFFGDLLAENHTKLNKQLVRSHRFCNAVNNNIHNHGEKKNAIISNAYLLDKVKSSMICDDNNNKKEI